MKPISILAISFYVLACGEPIDKWVGTWQGGMDPDGPLFIDWRDRHYLFIVEAGGDFKVRDRYSGKLVAVGDVTVMASEFTMYVSDMEDRSSNPFMMSGTWARNGEYLFIHYRHHTNRERVSRFKWRSYDAD